VTTKYTVTLLQEAVADLRRLEDFAIERELANETPDRAAPQRAWTPSARDCACCLGRPSHAVGRSWAGRSRELIAPFGGTGYIVLFEIVDNVVVIGAVRHLREEDYRH
jgi:hypothetical protein